ncbi:MAG: histidine kinase dimerization/phospho-acceptor domain-containing protein, partial [Clostridiaceae bacterium]
MRSIRNKLATAITVSSLLALIISYMILNYTISRQFSLYLSRNQAARDEKIVGIFRDSYLASGINKWTSESGTSVIPEARASGFSVKLEDSQNKLIWQLSPETIISELNARKDDEASPVTMEQFKIKRYTVKVKEDIVGYVTIGQYSPLLFSEDESRFIFAIASSIFISALLGGMVILFLSFFLSNQLSDPIKSIANTSYRLSMGELTKREEINTDIVEIEKLKDSINALGEKLDKQDILRKRLISDISHELRNPLNVLQTNLEAMIDGVIPLNAERLMSLNNEV